MDGATSSVQKGESLEGKRTLVFFATVDDISVFFEDSIVVMSGYSDVVVLRHPEVGAVTV